MKAYVSRVRDQRLAPPYHPRRGQPSSCTAAAVLSEAERTVRWSLDHPEWLECTERQSA